MMADHHVRLAAQRGAGDAALTSLLDHSETFVPPRGSLAVALDPPDDSVPPSSPADRFHLRSAAQLAGLPRMAWRVRSTLPRQGIAGIFGSSTAGKTFIALDLTAATGEGAAWFGHRVTPCRVVYVVLEGEAGFRLRIEAWEKANGRSFPPDVLFLFDDFCITERDDVLGLGAAIDAAGGAGVVVIDTLNRSAPLADENSSRDMGAILEGAKQLQALTGGLVVLVHHCGKDATKGMRGHSSLFAALDAAIEVTRDGDRREWKVAKSKDGEDGKAHPFRLRVVDMGLDEDGEPTTSCAVEPDRVLEQVQQVRLPKGGNQKLIYDALRPLFKASRDFGKPGAPPTRPCLELEAAITTSSAALTVEPRRRNDRARQAITGLIATGVLGCSDGWIWLK